MPAHTTSRQRSNELGASAGDGDVVTLVRVPARWPNVRPIANHVEFCVTALTYEERGKRAGVVAHELMENAVKYGDLSANIEIEVRMPPSGMRFTIRVSNRASVTRFQSLREEVERIGRLTPEQAFMDAIRRAGGRPSGNSMIGLSRIAHEGGVALSADELQGLITVVARG
ncbi:MAG TPA: hypothetical protein VM686_11775 [Polyangiaceae bacterium]|jgi:hypothetical protein|nr:hypothetical protein [Polyangiaceae bacterium]